MPKATLVLTTIFDPVILEAYFDNFDRHGHLHEVEVIVVPDKKTPPAAYETCCRLAQQGLRISYPSIDEQECYLRKANLRREFVPYNSDNRRNVGFLMALQRQPDVLISIDDDNYCLESTDYFAAHIDALSLDRHVKVSGTPSRFLNACDLLEFEGPGVVYPRGYPYFARHQQAQIRTVTGSANVLINAGLWLRDPDVDAITWLGLRPSVRGYKEEAFVLDASTWCPVNSQNTALRRELIPAYYFIRMGYPVQGMPVDRYGDIFSGYFALACAKRLGGTVRFGTPIADHRRNRHDYLRDASLEWQAIILLEDVLQWLIDARLDGSSCEDAYLSLSYGLQDAVETFRGSQWTDAARGFFHQMAHCMRAWHSACRILANG
jgi:hypothetical protein